MTKTQQLISNGYLLVPIAKGKKYPVKEGWQNLRITDSAELDRHLAKGGGLGILTGVERSDGSAGAVCAIDIDSLDGGLIQEFSAWCLAEFGIGGERIGRAPKALLMYRAAEAGWLKASSGKFVDSDGRVHQVEVLGAGQQFVAFGLHPDTGSKYVWPYGSPVDVHIDDLPVLAREDVERIVTAFEAAAEARGYKLKAGGRAVTGGGTGTGQQDSLDDDPLMSYEPVVGLSIEESERVLQGIDCDDYDQWIRAGMALHHEYAGGELENAAFDLWNTWSSTGGSYKGESDLRYRWRGFGKRGGSSGGPAITMRSILHEAGAAGLEVKAESRGRERRDASAGMAGAIDGCNDRFDLLGSVAANVSALTGGDTVLLMEAEALLRRRYKILTGGSLPVAEARRALRSGLSAQRSVDEHRASAYKRWPWVADWVYITSLNQFLNTSTGVILDPAGFKGKYDSELADDEEAGDASKWVLNNNIVPKADRAVYMPGAGRLFKLNGVDSVNLYHCNPAWTGDDVAALADDIKMTGEDGTVAETVRALPFARHLQLLIGGGEWTREVHLFANFLRYIIEKPGRKITWAVLMQGGYGDGKSLPITRLMGMLLGHTNIRAIQAQTIEGSIYNSWAEGHCFAIIEEIKLHGHNRYDIINRMNTPISNDIIEIHRKKEHPYVVNNTGNYYITTNFTDAMPIVKQDRRYFVLFSKFPDKYRNNSDYFNSLFNSIKTPEGVRAVGRWLLSVPYHPDFVPSGHAPHTEDKDHIIELSRDACVDDIEEALSGGISPYFNEEYVVHKPFREYIDHVVGVISDKLLHKYLQDLGFKFLGRHRIDGVRHRVWARGRQINLQKITDKLEMQKLLM